MIPSNIKCNRILLGGSGTGIKFLNAVAKLAEEYDHFPVRDS